MIEAKMASREQAIAARIRAEIHPQARRPHADAQRYIHDLRRRHAMTPWSLDTDLDRLPAEERDLMESALAYAGAYLRDAPRQEQRRLRRRWLRAFRRRWPERSWPLNESPLRRVS